MKIGLCKDCCKRKELTKHSSTGHHIPPYIRLCEECHKLRHWRKNVRTKIHRVPAKGDLELMKESLR